MEKQKDNPLLEMNKKLYAKLAKERREYQMWIINNNPAKVIHMHHKKKNTA